eukprot:15349268-Ditylum_brightwellii.AAC.1
MSSTPTYTDDQLKDALSSLYGPNPDETCSHLHGYGDPEHKLSMLQRITATRVLDYEKLVVLGIRGCFHLRHMMKECVLPSSGSACNPSGDGKERQR